MTTLRYFAAAAAVLLAACDAPTGAPAARADGSAPSATWNTSTDSLGVSFAYPVALGGGMYRVTATVTGGNGNYEYNWYTRACYDDGYCDRQYMFYTGGAGLKTVDIYVHPSTWKVEFGLQVNQVNSNRSGKRKSVIPGPSVPPEPRPVESGWSCTAPAINYNLYHREKNENGVDQLYFYRRAWCTGERQWQDEVPISFRPKFP
jgi:hypothetical protein